MAVKKRPQTAAEYVDLVDQAIFELEELRMAAEYDMESLGKAMDYVDDLEKQMRALRASMADGSYKFGREDLPFMDIVRKYDDDVLPFRFLFQMINDTHKLGLDVGED